jgi:hypothetical protein
VHDGTLVLPELRIDVRPFLGLLGVRGDLVVEGLFEDSLEPDSVVIVTGDLRAERLISESCLKVHDDDWCIDYIEDDVLRELVAKGNRS